MLYSSPSFMGLTSQSNLSASKTLDLFVHLTYPSTETLFLYIKNSWFTSANYCYSVIYLNNATSVISCKIKKGYIHTIWKESFMT